MAASMIDIEYLQKLVEIFDTSTVNDLRIEQEGVEIRLSKSPRRDAAAPPAPPTMPISQPAAAPAQASPAPATVDTAVASAQYHEIRSPIVGTFYGSPSPDAPPYAVVGSKVSPGTVLCIIEAMKLMNEIECDAYGRVVKTLVENAQPVEYNQLLFLIEQD